MSRARTRSRSPIPDLHSVGRSELSMCDMETPTRTAVPQKRRSRYEGVVLRHSRSCRSRAGERCSCSPAFQAQVWSSADQKTIRKTFATLAEARNWRHESQVALRKGTLRSASQLTLDEAAETWLLGGRGRRRPDAHRRGVQALRGPRLPAGAQPPRPPHPRHQEARARSTTRCCRTSPTDSQPKDSPPSSVRNTILPLRAIYRRAHHRNDVAINPTLKLILPVVRGERERIAAPTEVAPLLDALQPARPRHLRHRALRRPPTRRTPSPAMGRHRPRHQPHPHPPRLGPPTRIHRHPKAAPAHAASPSPPPSAANSSPTASTKAQAAKDSSSPTKTATSPSTPAPSNSTPPKPGTTPTSNRSASTNAATPTPPT